MAWNDNAVPYGSRLVYAYHSITSSPAAFSSPANGQVVFENFTLTQPQHVILRYNQVRAPSGAVGIDDFMTGTANVQLATNAADRFMTGDGFGLNIGTPSAAHYFVVKETTTPESQGEYKRQTINFQEIQSTVVGVSAS